MLTPDLPLVYYQSSQRVFGFYGAHCRISKLCTSKLQIRVLPTEITGRVLVKQIVCSIMFSFKVATVIMPLALN